MSGMNTETDVLAAEAANFDRIAGELKGILGYVDATASGLAAQMQGAAGTAAQQALTRFQEAAQAQNQQLMEISSNIGTAGIKYTTTDEDQAGMVGSVDIPTINL